MADPAARANAARSYLEMLGIDTRRRRRPMVDVSVGEARVDPPVSPEEQEALRAFAPAPSHGSYPTEQPRPSFEQFEQMGDEAAAAGRARQERQATRMRPETVRGNVRAGLPNVVPDAVSDAIASTPAAAAFDPDLGAAAEHGVAQGLTLGHEDEIAGMMRADESRPGQGYLAQRDRVRAQQDEAQGNAPLMYGVAELTGSLPLTAIVPSPAQGAGLTARLLGAGAGGAAFGTASGSGHSRADMDDPRFAGDVARDATTGAVAGVGSELLLSGGRALYDAVAPPPPGTPRPGGDFTPEQRAEIRARRDTDPELWEMARNRELAEDAAATRRVRSTADSAALSDVRRAGDYNGPGGEGYRGLARDLDETGIQPRRSLGGARDAQLRAARLEEEAGEQLGDVRRQMRNWTMPDDIETPILTNPEEAEQMLIAARAAKQAERDAAEGATGGARGGRQRPRGVSMRNRTPDTERASFEDLNTPTPASRETYSEVFTPEETRRAVIERADPARVRYQQAAETLREDGNRMLQSAVTPAQEAEARNMLALADRLGGRGADTFDQSVSVLRGLDSEAAYGRQYPNAPDAGPRVEQARAGRRVVREAMDESVGDTLGPDALADYRTQRGRFGAARATQVLGQRGAEREAANLQAGLGDTLAIQSAMGQQAPITARLTNAIEGVLVNRYLRGRAHAGIATMNELRSDSLAAAITRRLSQTPEGAASARALAAAQGRGPRAYGLTLMRLSERDPAVQQALAAEIGAEPDYQSMGLPTADQPLDDDPENDTDWGALGLPTADDYEEEQRR